MENTLDSIAFFLPTRKGSERVLNKNTRKFANIEDGLLELKLRQLIRIKDIPVILSTNDPESIRVAEKIDSSQIIIIERPEELCLSTTRLDDLIEYVPTIVEATHIMWTHTTSPFLTSEIYKKAIQKYFEALENGYDSMMSVDKIQNFIWDPEMKEMANYDRTGLKWPRTQDLKPLYGINSGFFINSRENYFHQKDRIGHNPALFELDAIASLDIDWEEDFRMAEEIFKIRNQKNL